MTFKVLLVVVLLSSLGCGLPMRNDSVDQTASSTRTHPSANATRLQVPVSVKLPLKIKDKDDLTAWGKYVMQLMASRINISLASLKDVKLLERPSSTAPTPLYYESKSNGYQASESSPVRVEPAESFGPIYQINQFEELPNDLYQNPKGLTGPLVSYVPILFHTSPNITVPMSELIREKTYQSSQEQAFVRNPSPFTASQPSAAADVINEQLLPRVQRDESTSRSPVLSLPFEAVITITRDHLLDVNGTKVYLSESEYNTSPGYDKNPASTERVELKKDKRKNNSKDVKADSDKGQLSQDKRRANAIASILRTLGFGRQSFKNTTEAEISSPLVRATTTKVKLSLPRGRINQTSQNQEIEEDDDDDGEQVTTTDPPQFEQDNENGGDEGGSLGPLFELLPLVAPILEDLSDPESDTDLTELLEAAVPLLESFLLGDEENPNNIAATVSPIIKGILAGKDGKGIDLVSVIGSLIAIAAPLIGPLVGPLAGPLLRTSSNPTGEGGSDYAALVNTILKPLTEPTAYGGASPLSKLISNAVTTIARDLVTGQNGLDLSALVSSVVSGTLAGASSGLSSSSGGKKSSSGAYGAPNPPNHAGGYQRPNGQRIQNAPLRPPPRPGQTFDTIRPLPQNFQPQLNRPIREPSGTYGQPAPAYGQIPASQVNPLALIGETLQLVLSGGIQLVTSLVGAVTGTSAGSSQTSSKPSSNDGGQGGGGAYGPPPQQGYGYQSSYQNGRK